MAKKNKEFEWRMQGMLFAHKIVKEKGLDELTKEIKMRNLLKLDIWADAKEAEELQKQLAKNIYMNMLVTFMYAIHEVFGFRKVRLHRLKEAFDKSVQDTIDLDYMGEHYVRLEDYAIELNKKYDLGIDVERIAACQDLQDEKDKLIGKVDRKILLQELRNNGFADAAEFIEKKVA